MPTNEFEGKPNPRKSEYKQKEERYSLRQNNPTTAKIFFEVSDSLDPTQDPKEEDKKVPINL